MPARFDDILSAFEFISGDGGNEALLCKRTGKVYWRSELAGVDEIADELPDGVEEDANYIAVPRKQVLGLGKALALDFAREFCRTTSTASETCLAGSALTGIFARWCPKGGSSSAGTISNRRPPSGRCANGVSTMGSK
jgi:hypothetical protein